MLSEVECTFVPGIISFFNVAKVIGEALLGSPASGGSPLALPWGRVLVACQTAGQRRGGKATLRKPACTETIPTDRHHSMISKLYQSCF